jgi:hypothetical protein
VNGEQKVSRRGKRVTRIDVAGLPQGTFTVKIVASSAMGRRTVSVRRYKGCKKSRPSSTTHAGHRR